MRILLGISKLTENGATLWTLRFARWLAARDVDVHVAACSTDGTLRPAFDDIATVAPAAGWRQPAQVCRLAARVARIRPDAILASLDTIAPALVLAGLACTPRPRTVVRIAHHPGTLLAPSADHRIYDAPAARKLLASARAAYPLAHRVVALTDADARSAAAVYRLRPSQLLRIPNPAPSPDAVRRARTRPAPHPWLAEPRPTLLAAGRLFPQKNHAHLLRAFARIAPTHPDARLLVFGDGPLRDELQQLLDSLGLHDRAQLAPWCPDLLAAMTHARAFALPSLHEGFPTVLLEALACGLPSVVTDFPGVPHELHHPALLPPVPRDDEHALADALSRALHTPPLDPDTATLHLPAEDPVFGQLLRALSRPPTHQP